MSTDQKVVLDRDDLRRTLVRIAHEIVEKNPGRDWVALVGIHTRGAVLGERLHALVGELTGSEVPFGDLDISFYRDDVDAREPGAQPVVHASHLDFDARWPHRRAGRRRAVHGADGQGGDRRPVRLRAPPAGPARRARRPWPPRAADPPRLRRQEPARRRATSASMSASRSSTASTRWRSRDERRRRRGEAPARDRGPRAR